MDFLMIVLRITHILFGVLWVGTTFFIVLFFEPTIRAAGPAGGTVMGRLVLSRFSLVIALAAILTVGAGTWMYIIVSNGLQTSWVFSPPGVALTIGAVSGILAFIIGAAFQGPTTTRMTALQKEIQSSGNPPSPSQLDEMRLLQNRIKLMGRWGAVFMVIAVICMATARELGEF